MGLTRKQWMMLTVIVVGTFVTILNQTLVTPALPAIMAEMSIDAATGQWLTTGFTLVNAIMIPITAYLQDRFSVRRLFLFSMSVFAVGSLLCGWGPDFGVLLAGRLVQAIGAGILMPMSMTVLLVMFPVDRRGSAMGVFGLIIAFAPAIGPTISGIMVDTVNWHVMFYVIAGLVAVVVVAAAFLIEQHSPKTKGDAALDPLSVVLSTLGFGGMLYGFSVFGSNGIDLVSGITILVGCACIVWFFFRQLHLETPMLRVRILFNRNFLIATIIGMLLLAATTLGFVFVGTNTSIAVITILFAVRMFSMALVNMPITTWGMNALDTKFMNHGTSINNTLRQVAGSLGTALVVSIYTAAQVQIGGPNPPVEASMTAFNIAFMICTALVLIGAVLTIIFVKGKPGTIEATGAEGETVRERGVAGENKTLLERIMKRDVYVLRSDDTVQAAMQLFINEGISACPIVDHDDKPVGFISDGDILKNLARNSRSFMDPVALIAMTAQDKRGYDEKLEELMEKPVASIGTRNFLSVNVHESIDEVCRVLADNHLKKVPVMEDGKICGIINRSDIIRYSMEAYLEGRPEDAVYCEGDGDGTKCECEPEHVS